MKITAPHYVIGPILRELYDASVDAVLMERTGPGWMLEFAWVLHPTTLGRIVQMGGVIVQPEHKYEPNQETGYFPPMPK